MEGTMAYVDVSNGVGYVRTPVTRQTSNRDSGVSLERAAERLSGYRSILSSLTPSERERALSHNGYEVAGKPGSARK